jgi:hypothetical protein
MPTVIVIPIIIEFSPETFLHIMLELWIESENEIMSETETDNNISEADNNLIEETCYYPYNLLINNVQE